MFVVFTLSRSITQMSENNDPQYDDPPHQHTPTAGVTQEPGWETLEYEHSSAGQPAGERTVIELSGNRRASPGRRARRAGEAPGEPARPRRHGGLSWIQAERRRGARGMCRGRDSARDHQPPKARSHDSAFDERQARAAHPGSHPLGASTTVNLNDERRRPPHLQPPGPAAIAVCRLCRRRPQPNQQPARRPARPPRRRRCAKQTPKDKQGRPVLTLSALARRFGDVFGRRTRSPLAVSGRPSSAEIQRWLSSKAITRVEEPGAPPSVNKAGVIASWWQTNGLSQGRLQDRRRGSAQARVLAESATAPTRPSIIFGIAARDVQPDPRGRSFRVPIAWDCAPGGQSPSGFRICADGQSRLCSARRPGRRRES